MTIEDLEFYQTHQNDYLVGSNQFKCPLCQKIFSIKGFKQHIRKEHYNKSNAIKNSGGYNGHYLDAEFKQKCSQATKKNNRIRSIRRFGEYKTFTVTCDNPKCGKQFVVYEQEKRFLAKKHYCSLKCSHSRTSSFTLKTRQKLSTTMKNIANYLRENNPDEFQRRFGPKENNRRFTSKNERKIRDFIKSKFPEDNWTFGGHIVIDGLGITRDLYSNKLKICFEYDGVWHFKDIHGQLESKQKKDYALEKWCKINGYRLIRISESWFTEELKSNVNEVVSIIYNTTDQILKFGKEYN